MTSDELSTRVFISSTYLDTVERRQVVRDAVLRAGLIPVGVERFAAISRPVAHECAYQIHQCDWFLGILAHRYGWIPPGQPEGRQRSIMEIEYDTASQKGMPRLILVVDASAKVDPTTDFDVGDDRWKKQEKLQAFKARAEAELVTTVFRERELGGRVFEALSEELARQFEQGARSPVMPAPTNNDAEDPEEFVLAHVAPKGCSNSEIWNEQVTRELARVFCDREMAILLAGKAGVPKGRIPFFHNPTVFWNHVVDEARNGLLSGGVEPILEMAAQLYPNNAVFGHANRAARSGSMLSRENNHGSIDDSTGVGIVSAVEMRRYLIKARSLHQDLQLMGFETNLRVTIPLDDMYVPLDGIIDRGGLGREIFAGAQVADTAEKKIAYSQQEEISLSDAFRFACSAGKRGLIVLGDPGSGKTTHLKQILLKIIADGSESVGLPTGIVPVFLPLRELRDRSGGLPEFIQQQLEDPMLDMESDFAQRLCRRGMLLFLLDGLDEVAGVEERAEVARWIERSHRAGPDCYFLVSCRYAGYDRDVELDPSFLEVHLRSLTDEQVRCFVTHWYLIVERAAHGDTRRATAEAKRRTKDLLQILSHTDFRSVARVYAMTRNPLLLTTICLIHRDRGRLPRARAKLYEESVAVLLARWCQRLENVPLSNSQLLRVLRAVAYWMHNQRGRTRVTASELLPLLQQDLLVLCDVEVGADVLLRALRDEGCLLSAWGMDEYGFVHLGLQEFLAAQWLRGRCREEPAILEALACRFGDSWWQEVILLLLAQADASVFEDLMRTVVRQSEFLGWTNSKMMEFAFSEAAEVSAVPFVELLSATPKCEEFEGLSRRQLAAVEILAREMPQEIEGLAEVLRDHPVPEVRAWWWERQSRRCAGVVEAPRGGIDLVFVRGGTFMMGSPEDEMGRNVYQQPIGDCPHRESPRHEVEVASFYMSRTSVTNAQYADFLKANPTMKEPKYWGDQRYNQPDYPVVGVSWYDAMAYCEWSGLKLPTEVQWEYACRARATTRFCSGMDEEGLMQVGWCSENSEGRLHTVGEKQPNGFGLYDMHGNILEWCLDAYAPYTIVPRRGDGLRLEPEGDAVRVLRGGCFLTNADWARSAHRLWDWPGDCNNVLGFRAVQAVL